MDRRISGTRPNGRARESGLKVTHRAGGLEAPHVPRRPLLSQPWIGTPRSFCSLIWTTRISRRAFLNFFLTELKEELQLKKPVAKDGVNAWPQDPDELLDVTA